jgi:hypothetical protein
MAALAIELRPDRSQPVSDHADVKALLAEIIESEIEFEYYFVAARMAISGKPEDASLDAGSSDEVPRPAIP